MDDEAVNNVLLLLLLHLQQRRTWRLWLRRARTPHHIIYSRARVGPCGPRAKTWDVL